MTYLLSYEVPARAKWRLMDLATTACYPGATGGMWLACCIKYIEGHIKYIGKMKDLSYLNWVLKYHGIFSTAFVSVCPCAL